MSPFSRKQDQSQDDLLYQGAPKYRDPFVDTYRRSMGDGDSASFSVGRILAWLALAYQV